ncbi:hypothetical protein F4680DRAFT_449859 [Xylaria scruposa]|nr:hypothetical protein F4680DRAFT_449859 [Xylaria scruposa]
MDLRAMLSAPDTFKKISAHTTDSVTYPQPVRSPSPCTGFIESNQGPRDHFIKNTSNITTQTDIGYILRQLQTDLIRAALSVLPPRCEACRSLPDSAAADHLLQSAISECINNALRKWAPESDIKLPVALDAKDKAPLSAPEAPMWHIDDADADVLLQPDHLDDDFDDLFDFGYASEPLFEMPREISNTSSEGPDISNRKPCRRPLGSTDVAAPEFVNIIPKASSSTGAEEIPEPRRGKLNWNKYKRIIYRMYMEQDLNLPVVIRKMANEYGFMATVKQYRYQLGEKWKWKKYNQMGLHSVKNEGRLVKTAEQDSVNGQ